MSDNCDKPWDFTWEKTDFMGYQWENQLDMIVMGVSGLYPSNSQYLVDNYDKPMDTPPFTSVILPYFAMKTPPFTLW